MADENKTHICNPSPVARLCPPEMRSKIDAVDNLVDLFQLIKENDSPTSIYAVYHIYNIPFSTLVKQKEVVYEIMEWVRDVKGYRPYRPLQGIFYELALEGHSRSWKDHIQRIDSIKSWNELFHYLDLYPDGGNYFNLLFAKSHELFIGEDERRLFIQVIHEEMELLRNWDYKKPPYPGSVKKIYMAVYFLAQSSPTREIMDLLVLLSKTIREFEFKCYGVPKWDDMHEHIFLQIYNMETPEADAVLFSLLKYFVDKGNVFSDVNNIQQKHKFFAFHKAVELEHIKLLQSLEDENVVYMTKDEIREKFKNKTFDDVLLTETKKKEWEESDESFMNLTAFCSRIRHAQIDGVTPYLKSLAADEKIHPWIRKAAQESAKWREENSAFQ